MIFSYLLEDQISFPMRHLHRRTLLKSSAFGLLAVSLPNLAFAGRDRFAPLQTTDKPHAGYPSLNKDLVSEVVGKSHFDLERVKELVNQRPELSRSVWDWGFGDFESAIGAASHVGREEIVKFLLSRGARPSLFTYAMLGQFEVVKATCEANPGIQRVEGPHVSTLYTTLQLACESKAALNHKKSKANAWWTISNSWAMPIHPKKEMPSRMASRFYP